MTGRVQSLRSNVAGNRPTGRSPGELYTNWADAQLGVIGSTGAAQDLIAVTFYSTAASYAVGQFVIQAGQIYRCITATGPGAFNSANWSKIGTAQDYLSLTGGTLTGPLILAADPTVALGASTKQYADTKVPLAGGTMTGLLVLAADPTVALGAVTKQYVDTRSAIGSNRIINGDMRINQRTNGDTGTTIGVYTIDRWIYGASQTNKGSWQRAGAGVPLVALGFGSSLLFTSSSAYTPLAADYFGFQQRIEADMVSDFCWGTANAQPVTLSFLVFSTLTGTFGGSIRNDAGTRSYPFTFNIPAASTWTPIVITIPGDTAGTWVMSGANEALRVFFDLGTGANYRAAAGAWTAGDIRGATGGINIVATNSAQLALTGVKLEIGSVATPFNRKTTAESLLDCQRYYQRVSAAWSGNATTGITYTASGNLPATPRVAATLTGTSAAANGFANAIGTLGGGGPNSIVTDSRACNATTTGASFTTTIFADAEL
jgi:hypothetical protein